VRKLIIYFFTCLPPLFTTILLAGKGHGKVVLVADAGVPNPPRLELVLGPGHACQPHSQFRNQVGNLKLAFKMFILHDRCHMDL
jgi:hypothetical protein